MDNLRERERESTMLLPRMQNILLTHEILNERSTVVEIGINVVVNATLKWWGFAYIPKIQFYLWIELMCC